MYNFGIGLRNYYEHLFTQDLIPVQVLKVIDIGSLNKKKVERHVINLLKEEKIRSDMPLPYPRSLMLQLQCVNMCPTVFIGVRTRYHLCIVLVVSGNVMFAYLVTFVWN